ncbi:MAG TPA: anthranilate phosphoribosyltransferase [Thermodesulforhabdus norvegica]|uniref:Anthranilate phosphoribosyltransferase n=1 Tax=Thermodesulforhabdus norvegica TaxID=39841 RepID=A0A7C0WVC6_9BACT|nr:anthranilate phosphoribosyltransferase [Deltaproteobacteria bacterium]MBW2068487.1 anthranilate phosphoribosyltransferase [Deltaproteobacteria bacterium]HDL89905.1 anthranilate phosphoribosyltransferase [Thermodesulforhabdus norvegica]
MIRDVLSRLTAGENLSEDEMTAVMEELFAGNLTPAQAGAFLAALATKGETFEELAAAARTMRRLARKIQVTAPVVVDTCGTGGDGAETFNISTTSAFVVAGAGVTVAKHGNRSVSSRCGSADVLEALGIRIDVHPEVVEEAVHEIGIGFLFAPMYHTAMKHVAGPRKELGIRTIFNMLGPLTNPAGANCQVLGVFAPELTEMFAEALRLLGVKRAFVVHGHDGLDEISVCAPTRISEVNSTGVKTYDFYPEQYFGETASEDEMKGGDPEVNAAILKAVLGGKEQGPKRNVVLINSAAALVAAGKVENIKEGIELARKSIDGGAALQKLEALIDFTRSAV